MDTRQMSRERLNDPQLWLGLREELSLSPRELDVAILLVLGHSVGQIARRLGIAKGTAITYTKRLRRKVGVSRRCEVVTALLLASGLLLADDMPCPSKGYKIQGGRKCSEKA
jgi:DNA-binding CsgD family transcriptional regulator